MSDDLTRNQRKALDALTQSPTVAGAARACGLSESSLWRYLKEPAFCEALRIRQDEVIKTTTAAMVGLSSKAVEALTAILDDPEAPVSVKARVALGWLRQVRDTVELGDVLQRLEFLEAQEVKREGQH